MKKDWEIKKLGELTLDKMSYGTSSPSCEYDGETRYIRITDINDKGELNEDFVSPISYEEKHVLQNGDIVFARTGATVGKAYCYHSSDEKYVYAGYLIRLRPNRKIVLPDYIFYYTKSKNYLDFISASQVAAAQPNVNAEKYSNLEIPLPPLEEQKRIVKILDEKFAQLETIKTNAQTNLQNAKDLFQSQLTKAFSNTSWEKKRLYELCSRIFAGGDKPQIVSKEISETCQIPIYANGITDDGLYGYTNEATVFDKCLTISARGTIGFTCIRNKPFVPIVRLLVLIPKDEINISYLKYGCDTLTITNTGSSIPQLTVPMIKDYKIPLPPLSEQKRIVKELDTLSEKVRQLQEIYTKQISDCDELKQSLLQKAFEGEL